MSEDTLIRMANQIGSFFESIPDRQEALEGVASHIKKFWDPRMRKAFLAKLDDTDETQISDFVREAMRIHRKMLE